VSSSWFTSFNSFCLPFVFSILIQAVQDPSVRMRRPIHRPTVLTCTVVPSELPIDISIFFPRTESTEAIVTAWYVPQVHTVSQFTARAEAFISRTQWVPVPNRHSCRSHGRFLSLTHVLHRQSNAAASLQNDVHARRHDPTHIKKTFKTCLRLCKTRLLSGIA
jgi:hypothetical protein